MSVSKWRYTENCEGQLCPGDCDICDIDNNTLKDWYEYKQKLKKVITILSKEVKSN